MSGFDERNNADQRCVAFLESLQQLMQEHRVKFVGHWLSLQKVIVRHDDTENAWAQDMRDIASLNDGKQR